MTDDVNKPQKPQDPPNSSAPPTGDASKPASDTAADTPKPASTADDKPLTAPVPKVKEPAFPSPQKSANSKSDPTDADEPYSADAPKTEEVEEAKAKAEALLKGKDIKDVKVKPKAEAKPPKIEDSPKAEEVKLGRGGGFFKKQGKKVLAAGALLLFLAAIPGAIFLTQQSQELRRQAGGIDPYGNITSRFEPKDEETELELIEEGYKKEIVDGKWTGYYIKSQTVEERAQEVFDQLSPQAKEKYDQDVLVELLAGRPTLRADQMAAAFEGYAALPPELRATTSPEEIMKNFYDRVMIGGEYADLNDDGVNDYLLTGNLEEDLQRLVHWTGFFYNKETGEWEKARIGGGGKLPDFVVQDIDPVYFEAIEVITTEEWDGFISPYDYYVVCFDDGYCPVIWGLHVLERLANGDPIVSISLESRGKIVPIRVSGTLESWQEALTKQNIAIFYCQNQFNMTDGCDLRTGTLLGDVDILNDFCGTVQIDTSGGHVSYEGYDCGGGDGGDGGTPGDGGDGDSGDGDGGDTHLVCRNNACTTEPGSGSDECSNDADCSTVHPSLVCIDLENVPSSPRIGDTLRITCEADAEVHPVDHFEFRYTNDGGASYKNLASSAPSSLVGGGVLGETTLTVDSPGRYQTECRACIDSADPGQDCTNWGLNK